MNICEGCIKQDVCKFKEEVEEYEAKRKEPQIPEPLVPDLSCKHRREEQNWTYTMPSTIYTPSVWGTTTSWYDGSPISHTTASTV